MSGLVWDHHPLKDRSVPKGWAVAILQDLAESIQSGFPSGKHNREQNGVPHLRPMNVSRSGVINLSDVKYVEPKAGFEVRSGDVLFNNTNSPELIGKTAACDLEIPLAYSNHMTRLRMNKASDPKFFAYEIHWLWMAGYFRHRCVNHVNQASISAGPLSETVPLLCPPLAEQRRIVAEIDKQFTRLEQGSQLLQRTEKELKRLLGAGIRSVFDTLSRRGTQPFETVVETLRNGISEKPVGEDGVEILKISAVRPFQLRLEERRFLTEKVEYAPFQLKCGDLLFTRYNGTREFVGICARVRQLNGKLLYPDKLIRVRLKEGHDRLL